MGYSLETRKIRIGDQKYRENNKEKLLQQKNCIIKKIKKNIGKI